MSLCCSMRVYSCYSAPLDHHLPSYTKLQLTACVRSLCQRTATCDCALSSRFGRLSAVQHHLALGA
eukprot:21353-Heterococcus_DN1.PRE.2